MLSFRSEYQSSLFSTYKQCTCTQTNTHTFEWTYMLPHFSFSIFLFFCCSTVSYSTAYMCFVMAMTAICTTKPNKFFFVVLRVYTRVWKIALPFANSLMNWMKNCNRVGAQHNGIFNEWMNRLLMLETAMLNWTSLHRILFYIENPPTHTHPHIQQSFIVDTQFFFFHTNLERMNGLQLYFTDDRVFECVCK